MGFRDDFAAVGLTSILSYLGESVSFQPVSGSARTIMVGIVQKSDLDTEGYGERRRDVLSVTVCKDEATDTHGGVSVFHKGDSITRSGDSRPYDFIVVTKDSTFYWEAEFARDTRQQVKTGGVQS